MNERTEDLAVSDKRLREHLIALGFIRPARPASEQPHSNMRRDRPDYLRLVHPERSNGRQP